MATDMDLDLLAVTLMDIRAMTESFRRSVTNAQSSIEQFRHTSSKHHLADIQSCLTQIRQEAGTVVDSASEAETPLRALLDRP
jgi:hypothetical protein